MSPTFLQAQKVSSRPLVASMGPLSRLIAHAVKSVRSPLHIHNLVEALLNVSRTTNSQWRANKLSEIDASEEAVYLDEVALKRTIPLLWQILRSVLFAMTIVMKSIMGRLLIDGELAKHNSMSNYYLSASLLTSLKRCSHSIYSDPTHYAKCVLHLLTFGIKRIFVHNFRISYRHRRSITISCAYGVVSP